MFLLVFLYGALLCHESNPFLLIIDTVNKSDEVIRVISINKPKLYKLSNIELPVSLLTLNIDLTTVIDIKSTLLVSYQ